MRRIGALDGLRVVAALMVALYSYVSRPQDIVAVWGVPSATIFPYLHGFTKYGWLGIDLFFLVSGFVICLSSTGKDPAAFFRSRAIRLFPAFWPSVLITAIVLHLWPVVVPQVRASDMLTNLTLLHQPVGAASVDGVYWTLWTEVRFYLLFALLLWRGFTQQRATIFAYAWLIAAAVAVSSGERWLLIVLQPTYAPLFVAGIAFALIHRYGSSLPLWGLVAASFLLAQNNLVQRAAGVAESAVRSPLSAPVTIAVEAAFFAALAVIAIKAKAPAVAADGTGAERHWLTTAGLVTYPFFLLHTVLGWTVIHFLHDRLPPSVVLAGVLTLMAVAAWLVHYVIERPVAAALRARLPKPAPATESQKAIEGQKAEPQ
ncbi:acyltransferase family protein [Actinoplanes sp. NPDC051513]|uniref:acyltransferase family protein n=1 Tax=Actinoplanes sp. NPDC051513 TaxID=3363908 RepID=UPI003796BB73